MTDAASPSVLTLPTEAESLDDDLSGPARHLADESARLGALTFAGFDVRRLAPTIGAEVSGIDLGQDLDQSVVDELARALAEYKVLLFRDQPITSTQHVAFARRFGELELHPFIPTNGELPELARFERTADKGGNENCWHNDVTWREVPSKGAVLRAVHVPEVGGDTLFSDMTAAYDGLDDATKSFIADLDAEHDYMRVFGRFMPAEQHAEQRASHPLVTHPVVITHPVTGRKCLFVNRSWVTRIVGLDHDTSSRLLAHLYRQAMTPEYQVRIEWQPDSIVMWDNFAVQHYAASNYWPEVRTMERASIVGSRPTR